MIQRAAYDDAGQLRELWKLVFGDGDCFLDTFFGNIFDPEECLVTREGAQITAMLFMLPCVWSDRGGDRPMRYIYACATHPGHRRQGLMGSLLEEAARYGAERGLELSLVPEDHLWDYYGRFGFTERTYLYMRKYPAPAAAKDASLWQPVPENENAAALLSNLRTHFWQGRNAILWPEAHLKVALDEIFEQGGEVLVMKTGGGLPPGYALTLPDDGTVRIIECASALPQDDMINSLRNHYKNKVTLFSLAEGVAGSCAQTPFALVYARNSRGGEPPYLNLALDF